MVTVSSTMQWEFDVILEPEVLRCLFSFEMNLGECKVNLVDCGGVLKILVLDVVLIVDEPIVED